MMKFTAEGKQRHKNQFKLSTAGFNGLKFQIHAIRVSMATRFLNVRKSLKSCINCNQFPEDVRKKQNKKIKTMLMIDGGKNILLVIRMPNGVSL